MRGRTDAPTALWMSDGGTEMGVDVVGYADLEMIRPREQAPGGQCPPVWCRFQSSELLQRALGEHGLDGLTADLDDHVVGDLELREVVTELDHTAGNTAHGHHLVSLG